MAPCRIAGVPGNRVLDGDEEDPAVWRGLLGQLDPPVIPGSLDLRPYIDTLSSAAAPATVPARLWRLARRNLAHGIFEVVPGVYQVRGYDLANITFVRGRDGFVAIDALTTVETARAAVDLLHRYVGRAPITGIVYTHSHSDHYGGATALLDAASGTDIPIIAPAGFLAAIFSESLLGGNVTSRRSSAMYGALLAIGSEGHLDAGLGKADPAGTHGLLPPTVEIGHDDRRIEIDGVEIEVQLAPDTEAPATMHLFLPATGVLCVAENASHTMHNLLTIRGALVRDAKGWSEALDESIRRFGPRVEALVGVHHWPTWGRDAVLEHLARQRDLYRYMHDQTLRLANHGLTAAEIAEQLQLPPELTDASCGEHYGTLSHNVKAVYQRAFGWFDGNPATLHALPRSVSSPRYVTALGGVDAVVDLARAAIGASDLRWAAELLDHAVASDPEAVAPRQLLAGTYRSLGYVAESTMWRSLYLSAADELDLGVRPQHVSTMLDETTMAAMPLGMVLDFLAMRLDGPRAAAAGPIAVTFAVPDAGCSISITVDRGVLHHRIAEPAADDADVVFTREEVVRLAFAGDADLAEHARRHPSLTALVELLDSFDEWFPIVTRPARALPAGGARHA
jgi:alkyl sulfatase BDS1-like metallo-beta-lactamase superfamily hydrolase